MKHRQFFATKWEVPLISGRKRETEILHLISEGKKRNEIARELFIERETVKTHIKNIYAKLDVSSRSAAILAAKKNRLL